LLLKLLRLLLKLKKRPRLNLTNKHGII
jgi:hypothetical protein